MNFTIRSGIKLNICCDAGEPQAVKIAVDNLVKDLKKIIPGINVTVYEQYSEYDVPSIIIRTLASAENVIVGIDREKMEDEGGKLHKEAYQLRVWKGQLYIVGSDRRGTVYGIYTFCEWMGVSPWYFFADVPVKEKSELVLEEGYCHTDWPSVEYRGIFINDEEELDAWVQNYMGESTIGVKSYEKIFELLLRLKANYIWPAMHVNSFNLRPENGALAERMGIVVGTSHCDMLMRSNNREWFPWLQRKGYQDVVYDYSVEGRNREILKEYWKESVEQNQQFEVCYTLGMRGIHDTGFETRELTGKSKEEIRIKKVQLLNRIIKDQREILSSTLNRDTMTTFIPYKEVLDLYDHGLEIPEDVTLVWANDNYGYIRRFPSEQEKKRSGGNGIYYHNSYWSPPSMSYVFLCSIPLSHTRNELQKAWNEGIRKLWVLNSGAIKPLEQEITFFLRLAWEIGKPGVMTENVETFAEYWAEQMFSGGIGTRVSQLLNDFSQLTNVRKLENMHQNTFSQTAYGDEAVLRIHRYEKLFQIGNELYKALPEKEKDAFFQMVLMRIHAAYYTNLAYYYGDRSTLAYDQGKMQAAAYYTKKCREAEDARRKMLHYYNHIMCEGKWNGILNPEGFPPPRAAMLPVCTPPLSVTGQPAMRVDVWNDAEELEFTTTAVKWLDIGNIGAAEFQVQIMAPEWVELSARELVIRTEQRVLIRVLEVSQNKSGTICVKNQSNGKIVEIPIHIRVVEIKEKTEKKYVGVEEDGIITLEGDHVQSPDFKVIHRLGRLQGNLVEANAEYSTDKLNKSVPLRYCFVCYSSGAFLLEIHRFPSLNSTGRIRVGVAVDGYPVQIVESQANDEWRDTWKENVLHNVERLYLKLPELKAGKHEISIYPLDRYFAFSRMVIYTKTRKENELAGIRGDQRLPNEKCFAFWSDEFYGQISLRPRPVFYALSDWHGDPLALTDHVVVPERYGDPIQLDWYMNGRERLFREKQGTIRIDAAMVLAQGKNAWFRNALPEGVWRHCASESFGRSGLAVYIRDSERTWTLSDAPSLNYYFECEGGKYTVWILAKFNAKSDSVYGMGIDGEQISEEKLYGNGCLWRYEAEQIYRWVPVTCVELAKGEHTMHIYSLASGIRFDRIYITRGDEYPPLDEKWIE